MVVKERADAMHLLALLGIVMLVSVVGFLTIGSLPGTDAPTGNVVLSESCSACPEQGSSVCAVRDGKAFTYVNACRARCDDARVLSNGPCDALPRVGT